MLSAATGTAKLFALAARRRFSPLRLGGFRGEDVQTATGNARADQDVRARGTQQLPLVVRLFRAVHALARGDRLGERDVSADAERLGGVDAPMGPRSAMESWPPRLCTASWMAFAATAPSPSTNLGKAVVYL